MRVTLYGSNIILHDGQCSSNACMCSIYLSFDTMFQSLWFYEDFHDSGCCYQVGYGIKGSLSLHESWSLSFEVELIATMTWLTVIHRLFLPHELSPVCTCTNNNTTGITSGARTAYYFGAVEFNTGFLWVRVAQAWLFCVNPCLSLSALSFGHYIVCCFKSDLGFWKPL
jgi:hypothetical protein